MNMNSRRPSSLDKAPQTVNALARRIDLAFTWDTVLIAAAHRRRRRTIGRLAVSSAVVLVVIASAFYLLGDANHSSSVHVSAPAPRATPTSCKLPPFSPPGSQASDLHGPALDVLRGGPALASLELDGGLFRLDPPSGARPAISANTAECAALASRESAGPWLLQLAIFNGGVAIGYGRVSIAPALVEQANKTPFLEGQVNQNTHPILPPASPYQNRLAWVVVVSNSQPSNGGPNAVSPGSSVPVPGANGNPNYDYAVFVVDARTGSDALIYSEPLSRTRPAAVVVPPESVSVPWKLVSRNQDHHGYSGTIEATVLPCDGIPNPVSVEIARPEVAVIVERPVGAACGSPIQVRLPLNAASVTAELPVRIEHATLGPDVGAPPTVPALPAQSNPRLIQVGEADNGRTLRISVGDVIAITPLYGLGVPDNAPSRVESNNPSVLGPLSDLKSEVGEFRAWHAGHADLSLSACSQSTTPSRCNSPWLLHLDIT
jgi:hypothetical protein